MKIETPVRSLLRLLPLLMCFVAQSAEEPADRIADARAAAPGERVWRVRGTVTLLPGTLPTQPGSFYVQDASGGISVTGPKALQLGYTDVVEVEGTVRVMVDDEPDLVARRVTVLRQVSRIRPRDVSIDEALTPAMAGQLVRLRGLVVKSSIGNQRDDLFIGQGQRYIRAYFRRPIEVPSVLPTQGPVGAEVEVTGVLMPSAGEVQVLRLRESMDLTLVRRPSVLQSPEVLAGLGAAGGIGLLALVWILTLRRSIARQTAEIRGLLARAEESSRLKSEFLANLSHEIRTPIHGIQGMQALLLESSLSEEQAEELTIAQESTGHLLALLDEVLDFSRIESGRMVLENLPFDPGAVVKGVVRSFVPKARKKGLTVNYRGEGLPEQVTGDAMRLRQILLNLVNNAVKFTSSGGIAVEAWVEEWRDGDVRLGFRVTDTGIGIPQEQQALIFDSFRQVDGTISRRYGGSGLGLSIAQRLTRQMGGEMEVQSEPGVGSAFGFTAVFGCVAVAVRPVSKGGEVERGPIVPLRVLVAEDNEVNQRLVQRMLEKDGHRVTLVSDGRAAVDAAGMDCFDVILMDVQMPGMDGLQASSAIRQLEQHAGVAKRPIFALTAHGMSGDRERCLSAGMDGCLVKPFLPSDLRNLLAGVMRADG